MKKLLKLFLVTILLATTTFVFGQTKTDTIIKNNVDSVNVVVDSTTINKAETVANVATDTAGLEVGHLILLVVIFQVVVLFSDALKHIGSNWSWKEFLKSKITPFITNLFIFGILYIIHIFEIPLELVNKLFSGDIIGTVPVIFGVSQSVIDGLYKKFKIETETH